ncbi:MAG: single-stranded DNA-binding protein [Bacteroidales bacterium]|jgi:single-strand DNA-binding protein|nr:single-stranded DNA-binding protein [Bacteroidales bacterium]
MAGLNKVMLIGRLGKDPEVISFDNGGKKMTVTLATSERYRDRNGQWQDQTEWHNVVAWGNLANDIDEKRRVYAKGDLMFIEGKIRTRQYTDGQGVTKYITEILAEKMNLISKSNSGTEGYNAGGNNQNTTQSSATQERSFPSNERNENKDFDPAQETDDLPF